MEKLELPITCYKDTINISSLFFYFSLNLNVREEKETLDKYLVAICEGKGSNSSVDLAKKRLQRTFASKLASEEKESSWIMGATSELYLHFLLNLLGFNQEFIYRNLEEKSIKKGFDGVYTDQKRRVWLLESKSGSNKTKNISHLSKIKEAYNDLSDKFSGKAEDNKIPNDPWENALNHAKVVNSDESLKNKLKKLSDEYVSEVFHGTLEFNIIPCGTLFLMDENTSDKYDIEEIKEGIENYVKDKEYKEIIIICSTQKSYADFLDYIGVMHED